MSSVLIQGASLNGDSLQRLRELTGAATISALSSQAAWLRNVAPTTPAAATDFARQSQLDFTRVPRPLHAGDFRLLAMDMDSTLITIECIDEINYKNLLFDAPRKASKGRIGHVAKADNNRGYGPASRISRV